MHSQNSAEVSHYLGIDFGKSKVGLALADEETRMAFTFDIYKNDSELLQKLISFIEEKNINKIIIGIPVYSNNEKAKNEIEKLGELLKEKSGAEVFYQNEMFTTKMAQANLIERGDKEIGKTDDKESARIILQEWLDNN